MVVVHAVRHHLRLQAAHSYSRAEGSGVPEVAKVEELVALTGRREEREKFAFAPCQWCFLCYRSAITRLKYHIFGLRVHRNVQRFRGGLTFQAHGLCVSLNYRLESNQEEEEEGLGVPKVAKVEEVVALRGRREEREERLGFRV